MKFFGKKIFSVVATTILGCWTSVYAVPTDEGGSLAVSRMDIIDYIILMGTALFLIGIISVLLSMYLGSKKKSTEETQNDDGEEYIYPDGGEEGEPISEDEDAVIDEESEDEISGDELADEEVLTNFEDDAEEAAAEEVPEDISEPVSPKLEEEYKVRVTLTGMNNTDVKIAEFSGVATVGRRGTNDIMISDNAVSGSHCAFTYEDGVVYLKDCGSTNGTLLNGELIEMEAVRTGDIIVLGKHQYRLSITL